MVRKLETVYLAFLGVVLYPLRSKGQSSGPCIYIGETYTHRLMDGEVMWRVEVGTLE
jgi:hypothetical protein